MYNGKNNESYNLVPPFWMSFVFCLAFKGMYFLLEGLNWRNWLQKCRPTLSGGGQFEKQKHDSTRLIYTGEMQISYQLFPFVSLALLAINKHPLCEKASRYYAVSSELSSNLQTRKEWSERKYSPYSRHYRLRHCADLGNRGHDF